MQRNYFSILFYIRKTRLLKNGEAPIALRITMNGVRAELQIKRSVPEKLWNAKKGCAFARDERAQELNQYLEFIRTRVYQIHRELSEAGKPVSAEIIKLRLNGETDTPKTLLEIFREHNQKYRDLMGKEFAKGTVLRYERTVTYLEEFFQAKYNLNDIPMKNVTNSFVLEFEHYVKITKNCAQNAAIKYLKNLKKVTRLALANKWLDEDPFYGIRFHQTQTNRDFLTEEELNTIINRNFGIPRLEIVRDIFVFCSLTGLAFTDVKHLKPDHITYTPDSGYWIKKAREKTNNLCNVPLLEIPLRIIEKYQNHPDCLAKGVVLPVPSNQKMNSYLKEIADVCGINKTLSTHIARHTFACVAIANRVSMESIAKMLGHSDIKTTKIYARLMDKSVAEEMSAMRRKFDSQMPANAKSPNKTAPNYLTNRCQIAEKY